MYNYLKYASDNSFSIIIAALASEAKISIISRQYFAGTGHGYSCCGKFSEIALDFPGKQLEYAKPLQKE